MLTSKEMGISLLWLFVSVLQVISAAELNYTVTPQNTTVNVGKSTTFRCASPTANQADKMIFQIRRPEQNYTLTCPGNQVRYPSMSLYGRCDQTNSIVTATWDASNIGGDFNATMLYCLAPLLNATTAYLFVVGTGKYYAMLFGCVMGGFFGILIVFGATYFTLKRSEKCQECFKGKPEDEDPTITVTKDY